MRLALVGYGRMNRAVEAVAHERGHEIVHRFTRTEDLETADFSQTDLAMEFSTRECAIRNMLILVEKGVNTVSGTTGCQEGLPQVREVVERSDVGVLWSSNFSIGVNLFWMMVGHATELMNAFPDYDVFGHEFHHSRKADSPSGTARKTAEIILERSRHKKTLVTEKLDRPPEATELHFSSTRGGSVPGTHSVFFDSPEDWIEMRHSARSSAGFAKGAVLAGEWLQGKKGWFAMSDILADFLSHP